MKKVELEVVALSHSVTQSANYAVVLGEVEGERRLPVIIGSSEAQAIAVTLERMTPSRPLTHDLLKNVLLTFDIDIKHVIITNLIDGVFHSRLVCLRDMEVVEIDARTSDAIALAVRFDCPIYTYESIMDSAGIVIENFVGEEEEEELSDTSEMPQIKIGLAKYSNEELNSMLEDVLHHEDYEEAARIRDEIERRK